MTCKHNNSRVTDSRTPDHLNSSGHNHFSEVNYPCLRFRRRVCLDCGERFGTAEVPVIHMESTHPTREEIEREVVERIWACLR